MQAHPISLEKMHPGHVPAFAVSSNLQAVGSSPSEWYMYTYLTGLAHHKQSNPFTTTMTEMRKGIEGQLKPITMARNTAKSALDGLAADGLIRIREEERGVSLLLHITLL